MRRGREQEPEDEKRVDFSETLGNDGLYQLFVYGGLSIQDVSALIRTNKRLEEFFNNPATWERLYYQKVKKTKFRENKKDVEEWNFYSNYPPYVRLLAFVYEKYLDIEWRLKHTMHKFRVVASFRFGETIFVIVAKSEIPVQYILSKGIGKTTIFLSKPKESWLHFIASLYWTDGYQA